MNPSLLSEKLINKITSGRPYHPLVEKSKRNAEMKRFACGMQSGPQVNSKPRPLSLPPTAPSQPPLHFKTAASQLCGSYSVSPFL